MPFVCSFGWLQPTLTNTDLSLLHPNLKTQIPIHLRRSKHGVQQLFNLVEIVGRFPNPNLDVYRDLVRARRRYRSAPIEVCDKNSGEFGNAWFREYSV